MSIKENPLVALIEESIRLKDSAQLILSDSVGGTRVTRIERLVLIMITEADTAMTASQISRHLGHSRQVTQRAVNRLLELGLIRKLPNPDHKTSPLLEATSAGMEFKNELGETLIAIASSILSDSDIRMCQRLTEDLNKLRVQIEAYQARSRRITGRK
jgi:DNA-binding MarR family transcriptional regulator